jgi:ATP-dependent helicase IRC3
MTSGDCSRTEATMKHLQLRPYQETALHAVALNFFAAPGSNSWRQLGVQATGLGKTVLAASLFHQPAIAEWLKSYGPEARKMLFIAHRDELLQQAKAKILRYNPSLRVEIEKADEYASHDCDVVVASVQTLASRQGKRFSRFDKDQFRIVVVDEAHHSTASSYVRPLQYLGLLPPDEFMPKLGPLAADAALAWQRDRLETWDKAQLNVSDRQRLLLGLTATARRSDNVGLELVFQRIVFQKTLIEGIKDGYLSHLRAIRLNSNVNLDCVSTRAGDLAQDELAKAIDVKERNQAIVKAWLEHALGRKTVAFCASVAHSQALCEVAREHGIKAAHIDGALPVEARRGLLEAFHNDLDWLTNYAVLLEGYDEPNIQCIIMARPTKSALTYTQAVGRGSRLADGKQDCLIIDVADVTSRHQLVTAPTLAGLPAEFDTDGADLLDVVKQIEAAKAKSPLLDVEGAKSMAEIEVRAEAVDLFRHLDDPLVEAHASMAWIKTEPGQFEVSFKGPVTQERLSLSQNPLGLWETQLWEFGEPRAVGRPTADIDKAFGQAEQWLQRNRPASAPYLNKRAWWRKHQPEAAQITKLKKMGVVADFSKMTKGMASDLIGVYQSKERK